MPNQKTSKPVDLNRAGVEDLQRIEGIDASRAQMILELRDERGGFESWDELEEISGIGPVLVQKVKQSTTLGAASEQVTSSSSKSSGRRKRGGAKAQESEAAQEGEVSAIKVVSALVRLDLEAAMAYEVSARLVDVPDIAKQLRQFRDDHFRHVEETNPILIAMGAKAAERSKIEPGLLPGLAIMVGPLGPRAVLMALLNDEQMTTLSYEAVLAYSWDSKVQKVFDRNRADERRHLQWLAEKEEQLAEQPPEEQPSAPS